MEKATLFPPSCLEFLLSILEAQTNLGSFFPNSLKMTPHTKTLLAPSTEIISVDVPYLVQAYLIAGKGEREAQRQSDPQQFMLCLEIHNTANNVIKELQE